MEEKQEKNLKKNNHKKEAAVAAVLAASLIVPAKGAVKLKEEENRNEEEKVQAEYQVMEGVQAADNRKVEDLGAKKVLNKFSQFFEEDGINKEMQQTADPVSLDNEIENDEGNNEENNEESENQNENLVATLNLSSKSGIGYVGGNNLEVGIDGQNNGELVATSSNEEIATAYIDGETLIVSPKAEGTATITVEDLESDNLTDTYEVEIKSTSISLSSESGYLKVEETINIDISGENYGELVVTSTDENIATAIVNDNMLKITGKNAGLTTITLKETNGNKIATYNVTVLNLSIEQSTQILDLSIQEEIEILAVNENAGDLTWECSDESIAEIINGDNNSVVLKGKQNGIVTITVRGTNREAEATCELIVRTSVTELELDKMFETIDLNNKNKFEKLEVTIYPETANTYTNLIWTSEDERVATVDQNGLVTAVSNGVVDITVRAENGVEAVCTLTVQTTLMSMKFKEETTILDISTNNEQKLEIIKNPLTANVGDKLTWKSSNEGIATVDKNGKVTAVSNGEVTITATSANRRVATCNVIVQTTPTEVILNKSQAIIELTEDDKTIQLEAEVKPNTADTLTGITWESSNEEIAIVDQTGKVTGLQNGTANITVTTENGKQAVCEVTVQTSVTSIDLDKTQETLDITGTKEIDLNVTINPSTANVGTNITWESSNEEVAVVDESGKVVGLSNGTAIITATTENGKQASCEITVQTTVASVSFDNENETIDLSEEDKTIRLVAKLNPETSNIATGITWTSSNEEVAVVDQTGKVTGIKNGNVTITATTENGKQAVCNVKVGTSVTSISLDKTEETLDITGTKEIDLNVTINPSTADLATDITWTSSNEEVAVVDENGKVTAKGNGTAIITATSENGKQANCEITVQTTVVGVSFDNEKAVIDLNSEEKQTELIAKLNPITSNIATGLTWGSSDEEVATVDQTGKVMGLKRGITKITTVTENGKTAECEVKVGIAPTEITVSGKDNSEGEKEATLDLSKGKKEIELQTKIEPSDVDIQTDLSWISSNEEVAVVDENGKVTAKGNGTATITVTTENGKQATYKINVQTTLQDINIEEEILSNGISLDTSTNNKQKIDLIKIPPTANAGDKITWTSSNPDIVSVDKNGEITAVGNGDVIITATTEDGKQISFNVTSHTTLSSVDLNKKKVIIDLSENAEEKLDVTINPSIADTYTNLTWTSSDESVATVNQKGIVTGKQKGTAIITVTSENGKTAKCEVKVGKAPTKVEIENITKDSKEKSSLLDLSSEEKEIQLETKIEPSDADIGLNITWESSNTKVAKVDKKGKVVAVGNGKTTITATAENGKKATYDIEVQTSLQDIETTESEIVLDINSNKKKKLEIIKVPATANVKDKITYKSSDTSKVIVSSKGDITAVSDGTAIITATMEDGRKLKFKVTVITSIDEEEVNKNKEISIQENIQKEIESDMLAKNQDKKENEKSKTSKNTTKKVTNKKKQSTKTVKKATPLVSKKSPESTNTETIVDNKVTNENNEVNNNTDTNNDTTNKDGVQPVEEYKVDTLGVKEEGKLKETSMVEYAAKGTGIAGAFAAITGAIVLFFKRRKKDE